MSETHTRSIRVDDPRWRLMRQLTRANGDTITGVAVGAVDDYIARNIFLIAKCPQTLPAPRARRWHGAHKRVAHPIRIDETRWNLVSRLAGFNGVTVSSIVRDRFDTYIETHRDGRTAVQNIGGNDD